jgi:hypothetical protein
LLYHFTDHRNLVSIRKLGLLSWCRLSDCGIVHIPASNALSRELDIRHGLEDYVRLCLTNYHPMATAALAQGRVEHIAWLRVDPIVIRFGALFADRNATATGAIINRDPAVAYESTDPQAEVLIPGFIAVKWITFPDQP